MKCPNLEAALQGLTHTTAIPEQPGVYVLERKDNGQPWYVGQSINLKKRLAANPLNNKKLVRCKILVCNNQLDVEEWLIKALSPLLNRTDTRRTFKRRIYDMNSNAQMANILNELIPTILVPAVQREAKAILHKIQHPMAEILAKVPGTSLTERAKKLKVSRQTMYVWQSERFRPTLVQAKRIAKITGVPVAHIIDNGFEVDDDVRRKAHKKIARVAKRRGKTAKRSERVSRRRRRGDDARDGTEAA